MAWLTDRWPGRAPIRGDRAASCRLLRGRRLPGPGDRCPRRCRAGGVGPVGGPPGVARDRVGGGAGRPRGDLAGDRPRRVGRAGRWPAAVAGAARRRRRAGQGPRVRLVALPPEDSLIIIGSTGSGKTSGVAAPLVRDWGAQPAVVMSARTPTCCGSRSTSVGRSARSRCMTRPGSPGSRASVGRRWPEPGRGGAQRRARGAGPTVRATAAAAAICTGRSPRSNCSRRCMHAAAVCGLGMAEVMRWAQYRDAETPSRFLAALEAGTCRPATCCAGGE